MDIVPLKIEGLSCMNSCVATALNHLKQEYWYLFSRSFDLKYYEADAANYRLIGYPLENGRYPIGNRVSSGENDTGTNNYLLLAQKYFQFKDEILPDKDLDTIRNLLDKKQFVVLQTNVYWCSWLPSYKQEDLVHTVLVNKIMPDLSIECVDSMQSEEYVYMSYEDFQQGIDSVHLMHFKPCSFTPSEIFEDSRSHTKNSNMFAYFSKFIEDLKICSDAEYEAEFQMCNKGFWFCQLYRNTVYYLGGCRQMYAFLLQKLLGNLENYSMRELAEGFGHSFILWKNLKSPLMRYYYTKQFAKSRIALIAKLEEIREVEFRLYDAIQQIKL